MRTIRWTMAVEGAGDRRRISGPEDVARDLRECGIADDKQENFVVYPLNAKNVPIGRETVTRGIVDASLIHPREVFASAVASGAAVSVIVAHNHPSGDPTPSDEDRATTRRLRTAGEILGIRVLDHVIVGAGDGGLYSFRNDDPSWDADRPALADRLPRAAERSPREDDAPEPVV